MDDGDYDLKKFVKDLLFVTTASVAFYYLKSFILDPTLEGIHSMNEQMNGTVGADQLEKRKKELAEKLNRPEVLGMDFNALEFQLMNDVLCPSDISITFDDIGGMEDELEQITENICTPMQLARNFRDFRQITFIPNGVLLYGPPGTGKTLSAKAIAKESGATFIEIKASSLMSKWFGETNKMVASMFSLAKKLSPAIIFIDEIDTLLGHRGSDHPGTTSMLGHMLSEWDGLGSNSTIEPVLVLGTTNRPSDLDNAFLRRMPLQIKTKKPDEVGRADILCKLLKDEKLASDVNFKEIARKTEEFSGSDLNELVRLSTVQRAKEIVKSAKGIMTNKPNEIAYKKSLSVLPEIRPLNMSDFNTGLLKAAATGGDAMSYAEDQLYELHKQKKDALDRVVNRLAGNVLD